MVPLLVLLLEREMMMTSCEFRIDLHRDNVFGDRGGSYAR